MTETLHGWQCPRCNRVYAPATPECGPCNMAITVAHMFGLPGDYKAQAEVNRVTGKEHGPHDPKGSWDE